MKSKSWSFQTRFLHLGLVLTVTAQLFISLVMSAPDHKGTAFSKAAFEAHEIIGLTALVIVLIHWLWTVINYADGDLQHLFPYAKKSRQVIVNQMKDLIRFKLPGTNEKGGLVGLIHGLGLLAVTGTGITGAFLFVLFPETGEPGALAEVFAEMHESIAALVWTYWIGHGGMAIIHHFAGHDTMKNMFRFRTRKMEKEHRVLPQIHMATQHAQINKH